MTVRYGMEGYGVTLLQFALTRAGLDIGIPDGIYGRRTMRVLQRFQRDHGLATDGIAGKLTWAALFPYITGYTLHRIGRGDTFPILAERFGISIDALKTANPSLSPEAPLAGETMVLPLTFPVIIGSIPCTSLLEGLWVKGLTMRYPFIKVREIGRSGMGRPILALSLGKGDNRLGFVGAHHADGWITALVLLRFLEEYAAAYAMGGSLGGVRACELYERSTIHMVPLVNPDGVDLITGALSVEDSFHAQARALASHYPDIPFPEGWRSNIFGVDLGLQYPTGWETVRNARFAKGYTRPGPRDYAGSEPLIAPESRSVAKWTQKQDFDLTLSFDEGYRGWFAQTWHRPGYILETGERGGSMLPAFDLIFRKALPIMVRALTLSP